MNAHRSGFVFLSAFVRRFFGTNAFVFGGRFFIMMRDRFVHDFVEAVVVKGPFGGLAGWFVVVVVFVVVGGRIHLKLSLGEWRRTAAGAAASGRFEFVWFGVFHHLLAFGFMVVRLCLLGGKNCGWVCR